MTTVGVVLFSHMYFAYRSPPGKSKFRSWSQLQGCFNSKIFPIYDIFKKISFKNSNTEDEPNSVCVLIYA